MDISTFRDAVGKLLFDYPEFVVEPHIDLEPDELSCTIEWPAKDWTYVFAGSSWISILTAIKVAESNGDFEDPEEKYPEYF